MKFTASKIIGLVIVSLIMSLQGAQATSMPRLVATIEMKQGCVPGLGHSQVDIYANGRVVALKHDRTEFLATLSPLVMQNLFAKIAKINPEAQLVAENPNLPPCMGGSHTSISVMNGNGKNIEISKKESCRNYYINDAEGHALEKVLEGLSFLSYLIPVSE
jgi:hypothetical protein